MIIDVDLDLGPITRLLHGLTGALNDLRPVWQVIHQDFLQIEEVQFASEGERGGDAWPKLSTYYAKEKERLYPGNPILVASGRLAGSLASTGGEHRFLSAPGEMSVGSGVPYAVFHEKGTSRMPARPPISITDADKSRWMDAVNEYISRYLRRA